MAVEIRSRCAESGSAIRIFVDSELKWRAEGEPLIFEPAVDWATFTKPNIVDDY
jgi:hypothetical protein